MKYSIYKLDFFDLIVSKVSNLNALTDTNYQFDINECISKIKQDCCNNRNVDSVSVYIRNVDIFVSNTITECMCMNDNLGHKTVDFLNHNRVLYCFSSDLDEGETYIITQSDL